MFFIRVKKHVFYVFFIRKLMLLTSMHTTKTRYRLESTQSAYLLHAEHAVMSAVRRLFNIGIFCIDFYPSPTSDRDFPKWSILELDSVHPEVKSNLVSKPVTSKIHEMSATTDKPAHSDRGKNMTFLVIPRIHDQKL